MLKSLISLFSLALAMLGSIAGYTKTAYGLGYDEGIEESGEAERVQILTPLLIAIICAVVPYWTARFAGDILSNTYVSAFSLPPFSMLPENGREAAVY